MSTSLSQALPGQHVHIATDPWTEPFWNAAKEQRLVAAQCGDCGTFRMPPSPFCPHCQSQNTRWPELPGTATVYSFAICTKSPYPDVADFTYIPIIVELDGAPGIRLVSNLVNATTAQAHIGLRVKVAWHDITEGWKVPVFEVLK